MLPQPILPSNLETLLRLIRAGLVYPVPVRGAAVACAANEHAYRKWITGSYSSRDLELTKCTDCEAVQVWDVSYGGSIGNARLAQRRLHALLGWYTGRRRGSRTHFGQ